MVVESKLAYPEGRAAAEILKVANKDQSDKKGKQGVKEIALGSFIAAFFSLLSNGFKLAASEKAVWLLFGIKWPLVFQQDIL